MRKLKLEELNRISVEEYKEAAKRPIIVILDNIRSMHNVGSVLRTADAFRVARVYLCGFTPQPPHREIRKTAIGAEDSVEWIFEKDIEKVLAELKENEWKIWAIEQTDDSLSLDEFKTLSEDKIAIILGNEVQGVQDKSLAYCDGALEIPQYGTKHSLNISVATGIVLYALSGVKPI